MIGPSLGHLNNTRGWFGGEIIGKLPNQHSIAAHCQAAEAPRYDPERAIFANLEEFLRVVEVVMPVRICIRGGAVGSEYQTLRREIACSYSHR